MSNRSNYRDATKCESDLPRGSSPRAYAASWMRVRGTSVLQRRGFTLVELLVVVAVISLLAAMTLPTVRNMIREQKVSRVTNTVQAYFEVARAKAISSGKPYGVIIERLARDSDQVDLDRFRSVRIRYCSSPFSYVGDDGSARATVSLLSSGFAIQRDSNDNNYYGAVDFHDVGSFGDPSSVSVIFHAAQVARNVSAVANDTSAISIGDILFLGNSGYPLEVTGAQFNPGSPLTPRLIVKVPFDAREAYADSVGQPQQFRLELSPQETPEAALELTDGVSIDLMSSGFGRAGDDFSPYAIMGSYNLQNFNVLPSPPADQRVYDFHSIMVVFGPRGAINQVRYGAYNSVGRNVVLARRDPLADVHFCIARSEQIRPEEPLPATEPDDGQPSLFSGESLWLTIRGLSGEISVSPAALIDETSQAQIANKAATNSAGALADAIAESRRIAAGVE